VERLAQPLKRLRQVIERSLHLRAVVSSKLNFSAAVGTLASRSRAHRADGLLKLCIALRASNSYFEFHRHCSRGWVVLLLPLRQRTRRRGPCRRRRPRISHHAGSTRRYCRTRNFELGAVLCQRARGSGPLRRRGHRTAEDSWRDGCHPFARFSRRHAHSVAWCGRWNEFLITSAPRRHQEIADSDDTW